jgi:hypothetical protein
MRDVYSGLTLQIADLHLPKHLSLAKNPLTGGSGNENQMDNDLEI